VRVWTIHLYRRWTGAVANTHLVAAVLSALVEPFTFIPLLRTVHYWGGGSS
jgi:hypothetical protein